MNNPDLDSALAHVVREFPEVEIEIQFVANSVEGSNVWVIIDRSYGSGETFEKALEDAKKSYDPLKRKRNMVADELRAKADRIASGKEPLP